MSGIGPVIRDLLAERARQDAKWGEQNHDPMTWITILMEEVGEAAQEALRLRFSGDPEGVGRAFHNYRAEMIQVAAVAVAMVECFDRNIPSFDDVIEYDDTTGEPNVSS